MRQELNAPVKFNALPQDRHPAFRRTALSLILLAGLHAAPGGSGLMMTPCKTARIAARLRSVVH
jgi:hypothetical protein